MGKNSILKFEPKFYKKYLETGRVRSFRLCDQVETIIYIIRVNLLLEIVVNFDITYRIKKRKCLENQKGKERGKG